MSDYTQARKIQNLRKVSRSKADMCGATRDFRFGQKRTFRGRRSVSALSPEAYAERTLHCIRVDMRGLGYRSAVSLPAPASVHPATTAWQSCRVAPNLQSGRIHLRLIGVSRRRFQNYYVTRRRDSWHSTFHKALHRE